MRKRVLITGVTGVLGKALLDGIRGEDITALVRNPRTIIDGVKTVPADLCALPELDVNWDIIIHAAADTGFKSPQNELRKSNVEATQSLIAFARSCSNLRRFLHISTTCVSGNMSGSIPESTFPTPPDFQNLYEESKWQAEGLFASSGLPFQILRVPIVIGARATGAIRRPLVIHHTLRWISQGLVPFLSSHPEVRLDLISSDYVADIIRYTLEATDSIGEPVIHVCRGAQAPRITDVIDRLAAWLRAKRRVEERCFQPSGFDRPGCVRQFQRID
jgi:nucleoside-diphosphate-sugar epimerase